MNNYEVDYRKVITTWVHPSSLVLGIIYH